MYVIKSLKDVREMRTRLTKDQGLLDHIEKSWIELRDALQPDVSVEEFKLDGYGLIGILEDENEILTDLGVDYPVAEVWPDFVEKLMVGERKYYKIGVLENNEFLPVLYLEGEKVSHDIEEWLDGIVEEMKAC